jgi:hypothetical protein
MILRARKPIDLDDKKAKNVVKTNPIQKQSSKFPNSNPKKQASSDYLQIMARMARARATMVMARATH